MPSIFSLQLLVCFCTYSSVISSFFLFSLQLCATLDHFGYPAPLFSGWRQACWYNLHLTEVWLRDIHQNIINGCEPLPMIGAMLSVLPPQEEDIPESMPAATRTNAATTSSNPTSAAQPTVAQKEPWNRKLHDQAVSSTIGISAGHKLIQLDSPGSAASSHGKRGRSPSKRIRTRSLTDAHCVQRPLLQQILQLLWNTVRARLQKVTLMVIKGVYYECFAVTCGTDFEYF